MLELELSYWNELARQTLFVSALLGGFSLTVLATLVGQEIKDSTGERLFGLAITCTLLFMVSIFSMTNIFMKTIEGYPFTIENADLSYPRIVGALCFYGGVISLIILVITAGRAKSSKIGKFATILGVIALILVLSMLV